MISPPSSQRLSTCRLDGAGKRPAPQPDRIVTRDRLYGRPTEQAKAMTTRKITIMALIAGIVLGAAATEGFNVYRQSHDSQIFQERLRCKAVADAYVKEENSTDPEHVSWILDKVDYSPARNSCVADVEAHYFFRTPPF